MTVHEALYMLLGGGLVTAGVLVAALAERIRTRTPREASLRERTRRVSPERPGITVVETAELIHAAPVKPLRRKVSASNEEGGDIVIAALIDAGYKKPIAAEATWACRSDERVTVESWTAAALRRCVRGGMS